MNSEPRLAGRILLVIGGTAGFGLETARRAYAEGASLVITAREADRLHRVGLELGAGIAAFDATDFDRLDRFFAALPEPVDHVLLSGPAYDDRVLLPSQVARNAPGRVRPGGTLLFLARSAPGSALSLLTKCLALEIAPVRVNLIATGSTRPPKVATLALDLMTSPGLTGATFDADQGIRGRDVGDPVPASR